MFELIILAFERLGPSIILRSNYYINTYFISKHGE